MAPPRVVLLSLLGFVLGLYMARPAGGGAAEAPVQPAPTKEGRPRLTDSLVSEVRPLWRSVVEHRFTDELAAGTLDLGVLKCYLIQDHRFLDAFVVLLSSMVSAARSLPDRIPGCQFLALITGKENTYFERSFEALGVTPTERTTTPNATATSSFIQLMRDAARVGSLGEKLAVLVVAEWTYQSWGERVLPNAVSEPFYYREWVDLHSGEYFGSVVDYLRRLLDSEADHLDEAGMDAVRRRFQTAVQLEKQFFDACYN